MLSIPYVDLSEKIEKSSYQVKQNLSLLCKLVTVILNLNYVKGLRVTKIVK